jgi:hypothetical protein
MDRWWENSGQTLVEVAVVLPLLGLAIAVALQLIFLCLNRIELQVLAAKAVRQISVESPRVAPLVIPNPLWGRAMPPQQRSSPNAIQPWHPFKGPSTIQTQGSVAVVRVESQLLPMGGFGSVLAMVTQVATAETLLEPPRPAED